MFFLSKVLLLRKYMGDQIKSTLFFQNRCRFNKCQDETDVCQNRCKKKVPLKCSTNSEKHVVYFHKGCYRGEISVSNKKEEEPALWILRLCRCRSVHMIEQPRDSASTCSKKAMSICAVVFARNLWTSDFLTELNRNPSSTLMPHLQDGLHDGSSALVRGLSPLPCLHHVLPVQNFVRCLQAKKS